MSSSKDHTRLHLIYEGWDPQNVEGNVFDWLWGFTSEYDTTYLKRWKDVPVGSFHIIMWRYNDHHFWQRGVWDLFEKDP